MIREIKNEARVGTRLWPLISPEIKPTLSDTIYFAGFFDGEGCIYSNASMGSPQVNLDVTQSEAIDVLYWIRDRWAGTVRVNKRKSGPSAGKNIGHWYTGRQAHVEQVLTTLLPHLKVKNAQAIIALEMLKQPRVKEHVIELHHALKAAKRIDQ